MKKILALVLALVMVLTAVSAIAAGSPETTGAKTNPTPVTPNNTTINNTTTNNTTTETTDTEDTTENKVVDNTGNVLVKEVTDTDATTAIKQSVADAGLDFEELAAKAETEAAKQDGDAEAAEKAKTTVIAEATKEYVETLSDEVQKQILDEEGGLEIDDIIVNEMATVNLPDIKDIPEENKKDGKLTIKKTFQTPYEGKLKVLVIIPTANGEVQLVLNAEADENGDVIIEATEDQYKMMMGQDIVMLPISKAGLK